MLPQIQTQQFGQSPSFLHGRPAQLASINKYNPQQQSVLSNLLGSGLQGLQNPYEGFAPIAQQARSQFQRQTVPTLAERFAGSGNNALSSGAFASQLGEAGAGLEQGLAALQAQYGLQNRGQLLQQLGMGLTPQYEHQYMPREQGFWEPFLAQLLSQGGESLGKALPFLFL